MLPDVFSSKPLLILLSCVISYLLGSVSTGLTVARFFNGPDLRNVGSGNTGASNVQRTMGWKYGLITFAGDCLKGVLSCWIAELLTGSHMACLIAGLFVILGHNWPVYYRFRGGKGVAASCGVLLYCFPFPALICIAITVLVIWIWRYISVGSMLLVVSFTVLSCFHFFIPGTNACVIVWASILMVMCVARHHANISRLFRGTENKLGHKVK